MRRDANLRASCALPSIAVALVVALACVVAHKRHAVGSLGDQYVTMRLDDLVALLTGVRRET